MNEFQKVRVKQQNGIELTEYDESVLKVHAAIVEKRRQQRQNKKIKQGLKQIDTPPPRPKPKATKKKPKKKLISKYKEWLTAKSVAFRKELIERQTPYEIMFGEALDKNNIPYQAQKVFLKKQGFYIVDFSFILATD